MGQKFTAVLPLLAALLTGCYSSPDMTDDDSLLVDYIGIDDESGKKIRQIIIEFNQDVALKGAEPTQAQLAAVEFYNHHNIQCHWRFVDTRRLACDLAQSLPPASTFQIEIDQTFPGLEENLSQPASLQINSAFAQLNNVTIRVDKQNNVFGQFLLDDEVAPERFANHLKFKTPGGSLLPLDVSMNRHQIGGQYAYDFRLKDSQSLEEEGTYQLALIEGFKIYPNEKRTLDETRHYGELEFYDGLKFLGFYCAQSASSSDKNYRKVEIDEQQRLPCDPEQIALKFSEALPYYWNVDNALSGGNVDIVSFRTRQFVDVRLTGQTDYQLDLSRIVSEADTSLEGQLAFRTVKATADWLAYQNDQLVLPLNSRHDISVSSRNLSQLHGKTKTITSPQQHLQILNGQSVEFTEHLWQTELPHDSQYHKFTIPVTESLDGNSGLVMYAIADRYNQYETRLANVAAFNMVFHSHRAFHLSINDWYSAKPISDVEAKLVCEGMNTVKSIGRTDDTGTLLIEEARWQEIIVDATRSCWVWGQKGKDSAVIDIGYVNKVGKDPLLAIQAWPIQPLYQPGDVVEILFMAKEINEQGVAMPLDISNRDIALVNHVDKKIPLILQSDSQYGFYYAKWKTNKDTATGRYNIRMKLPDNKVQFLGDVYIETAELPQFTAEMNLPEKLHFGQTLQVDASAKRLNGVPLNDAKAELSYKVSEQSWLPWGHTNDYRMAKGIGSELPNELSYQHHSGYLDENGHFQWITKPLEVDVDWAQIDVKLVIRNGDGEVQQYQQYLNYAGRDHYIGFKAASNSEDLMEIAAFDTEGKPISVLDVSVEFSLKNKDEVLTSCHVKHLPAQCKGPGVKGRLMDVHITSGEKQQKSHLDYLFLPQLEDQKPVVTSADSLTLRLAQSKVYAGQTTIIEVESPYSADAQFVIVGSNVKKSWRQFLTKGKNKISLQVPEQWAPLVKVSAYQHSLVEQEKLDVSKHPSGELTFQVLTRPIQLVVDSDAFEVESGKEVRVQIKSDSDAEVAT